MATFSIADQNIQANTQLSSTSRLVPANINNALIQLTDPNNQWGNTRSGTNFIKCWGLQINRNDGQGWKWFLFQGDPTSTAEGTDGGYSGPTGQDAWLPFGSRDKSGGMPALALGSTDIIALSGYLIRLSILTNNSITLGASITVT